MYDAWGPVRDKKKAARDDIPECERAIANANAELATFAGVDTEAANHRRRILLERIGREQTLLKKHKRTLGELP